MDLSKISITAKFQSTITISSICCCIQKVPSTRSVLRTCNCTWTAETEGPRINEICDLRKFLSASMTVISRRNRSATATNCCSIMLVAPCKYKKKVHHKLVLLQHNSILPSSSSSINLQPHGHAVPYVSAVPASNEEQTQQAVSLQH